MSSQCKRDAFLLSYSLVFPSAPSGTLTMLRLASPWFVYCVLVRLHLVFGESDGRCVRASGPASAKLSVFYLLLNPPSENYFIKTFVVPCDRECSPFLSLSFATPRPDV